MRPTRHTTGVLVFALAPLVALTAPACSDDDAGDEGAIATLRATGIAFAFALPGDEYGRVADGTVRVLEQPEVLTQTDAEGNFVLEGISPGSAITLELVAEGFPPTQTRTFAGVDADLERVTFQVPGDELFSILADYLQITPGPERCQIVSTVTRVGKSLYDDGAHGEADATVSIEPTPEEGEGPIYFDANVLPDRSLEASSEDGGVLFVNVSPGDYTLRAHKAGVDFEAVTVRCRPGVLVNAAPPHGLQALAQ